MQMTLIQYRTTEERAMADVVTGPYYAVLPTIWLSDMLQWLSDIDAEVTETTDNVDYSAILPTDWPSYQTCLDCMRISDAIHCVL